MTDARGRDPDRTPLQHLGWVPFDDCYGCGRDNPVGLRIETLLDEDGVGHTHWTAGPHHQGPPGAVNGGVVAIPMDCHGTWVALAAFRARAEADGRDPATVMTVTGSYHVRLAAPTPTGVRLDLRAEVTGLDGRKASVHVETRHDGVVTATLDGTFIEVPAPT